MCGIVGYVGDKQALEVVLGGLRRLEYRGYDSAGVSVHDDGTGGLQVARKAGKLSNLEKDVVDRELPGRLGIGHTRWATHGPPTDANAHPHVDCSGDVAVVHNGTIENFEVLVAGSRHGVTSGAPTPTPRWSPTWSRSATTATCRPPCAASARTWRGPSSW
jgi:glucosamine--fructose-6-phosphate aminotransferase (isomerizing)